VDILPVNEQIIELPLLNPELFTRVGITPPKGVLLYGPPGTGKTLLARAVAATLNTNFLKVVSSAIVDKYIGESARVIREMFGYAREHEPCVIFMDEIDAIGGRRFSEGTSADREIQRTLMEVCMPSCLFIDLWLSSEILIPALKSNGRFRLFGKNEADHGYEQTRYS
jgi:ATP-dependent 26S proteasome regulatory subunit